MSGNTNPNQSGGLKENREGDFNSLSARALAVIDGIAGVTATVAGNPATLTDAKANIDAAILAVSAAGGGTLRFPAGDWLTSGNHNVPSNIIFQGIGQDVTRIIPISTHPVFLHGGNILNVKVKDLTIGGDSLVNVTGWASAGTYGVDLRSNGLRFENVKFKNLNIGHSIIGTGGGWQMANVSYDAKCYFQGCNYGVWYDTVNSTIVNNAFFEVGVGQTAGKLIHFGQLTLGAEFAGSAYNGREQVEKQTIVLHAPALSAGTAQSVITKGGVAHTVYVPLDPAIQTTAALVAQAFANAIATDAWATSNFHCSFSGADLYLINIDREANDATMNFTIENIDCVMVVNNTTSTNYLSGIAEVNQAIGFVISGAHGELTFQAGSVDEGFVTFLDVIGGGGIGIDGAINFDGGTCQGAIRINSPCVMNFDAGTLLNDRVVRDSSGCGAIVNIAEGCVVQSVCHFAGGDWAITGSTATAIGQYSLSNGAVLLRDANALTKRTRSQESIRHFFNGQDAARPLTDAPIEAYSTDANGARQDIKWGKCDEFGNPAATYGVRRDTANYKTYFEGSQASIYKGYVFDAPIEAPNIPVKSYIGLLFQSGTNAPTVTIIKNTLSAPIVFSRLSAGQYLGILVGEFANSNKIVIRTAAQFGNGDSDFITFTSAELGDSDSILIYSSKGYFAGTTMSPSDNILGGFNGFGTPLIIDIYS